MERITTEDWKLILDCIDSARLKVQEYQYPNLSYELKREKLDAIREVRSKVAERLKNK